jgi:hypothetical protein
MKTRYQCTQEDRTARFNLPVRRCSKLRPLLELFLAPPTRLHRYRNLSKRMLEHTLEQTGRGRCT